MSRSNSYSSGWARNTTRTTTRDNVTAPSDPYASLWNEDTSDRQLVRRNATTDMVPVRQAPREENQSTAYGQLIRRPAGQLTRANSQRPAQRPQEPERQVRRAPPSGSESNRSYSNETSRAPEHSRHLPPHRPHASHAHSHTHSHRSQAPAHEHHRSHASHTHHARSPSPPLRAPRHVSEPQRHHHHQSRERQPSYPSYSDSDSDPEADARIAQLAHDIAGLELRQRSSACSRPRPQPTRSRAQQIRAEIADIDSQLSGLRHAARSCRCCCRNCANGSHGCCTGCPHGGHRRWRGREER